MSKPDGSGLTLQEKIQANAEIVIKHIHADLGVELQYDEAAVKWVDEFINRHRDTLDQTTIDGLINMFGSFVGECIRHEFGGEWQESDGQWGIQFTPANVAFPFNKITKHFANGREAGDSVLSFYQTIPIIFHLKRKNMDEGTQLPR